MKNERSVGLGMFVAITLASATYMAGGFPLWVAMVSVVLSGVVIAVAEAMR